MYIYHQIIDHNCSKYTTTNTQVLQKLENTTNVQSNDIILLEYIGALAYECYNTAPNTNYNPHTKLQEIIALSSSKDVSAIINIAMRRLSLLDAYKRMDCSMLIKNSNSIIKSWPRIQGFYIPGLTDVLVMLSHAYHFKGLYEDGIHAIRLAIQISHEGLSMMQKYREKKFPFKLLFIGPILDFHEAIATSYHCLAVQLRNVNLVADANLALDWHNRSINSCIKFNVDVFISNLFCAVWHRSIGVNVHDHLISNLPSEAFVSIHQEDSVNDHNIFSTIKQNNEAKQNETKRVDELREVDSNHSLSGKSKRPHSANLGDVESSNRDESHNVRIRPKSAASKYSSLESKSSTEVRKLDILVEKEKRTTIHVAISDESAEIAQRTNSESNESVNDQSKVTLLTDQVVVLEDTRNSAAIGIQKHARTFLVRKSKHVEFRPDSSRHNQQSSDMVPGAVVNEKRVHHLSKLQRSELMEHSTANALNDITSQDANKIESVSKYDDDRDDGTIELNQLLVSLNNHKKNNKHKMTKITNASNVRKSTNNNNNNLIHSKRLAKLFRMKCNDDMHKSCKRIMTIFTKINFDENIDDNQVSDFIDHVEVSKPESEFDDSAKISTKVYKEILATWIHEQMDDIDRAVEVIKLGIKIGIDTDPNSLIDEENVLLFMRSLQTVRFLDNFQLDPNIKNALSRGSGIDSVHDELVDGSLQIINLIGAISLLLTFIENKLKEHTTGAELYNEIEKMMISDVGQSVLAIYDIPYNRT